MFAIFLPSIRGYGEPPEIDFEILDQRLPKLAVFVLKDFIDSLNVIGEQVEMKAQIKNVNF